MAPAVSLRSAVALLGTVPAVAGVDLDVEEGAIVCALGPNGAGKTSLLLLIAGLLALRSRRPGTVLGMDLDAERPRDARDTSGSSATTSWATPSCPRRRTSSSALRAQRRDPTSSARRRAGTRRAHRAALATASRRGRCRPASSAEWGSRGCSRGDPRSGCWTSRTPASTTPGRALCDDARRGGGRGWRHRRPHEPRSRPGGARSPTSSSTWRAASSSARARGSGRTMWRDAMLVAGKDLRIELRTKVLLWQVVPFAILALLLFALALGPSRPRCARARPASCGWRCSSPRCSRSSRSAASRRARARGPRSGCSGSTPAACSSARRSRSAVQLFVLASCSRRAARAVPRRRHPPRARRPRCAVRGRRPWPRSGTLYGALVAGTDVAATLLPLLVLPALAPVLIAGETGTAVGARRGRAGSLGDRARRDGGRLPRRRRPALRTARGAAMTALRRRGSSARARRRRRARRAHRLARAVGDAARRGPGQPRAAAVPAPRGRLGGAVPRVRPRRAGLGAVPVAADARAERGTCSPPRRSRSASCSSR